jgi:hypothetical protein
LSRRTGFASGIWRRGKGRRSFIRAAAIRLRLGVGAASGPKSKENPHKTAVQWG